MDNYSSILKVRIKRLLKLDYRTLSLLLLIPMFILLWYNNERPGSSILFYLLLFVLLYVVTIIVLFLIGFLFLSIFTIFNTTYRVRTNKLCKYCGEPIDLDAKRCKACNKELVLSSNTKDKLYKLLSPFIVFIIMSFLGVLAIGIGLQAFDLMLFGVITIVLISIWKDLFRTHDSLIYELGVFFSYVLLVVSATISIISLFGDLPPNVSLLTNIIIIIVMVSSLHIRLVRYDKTNSRFTYNKPFIEDSLVESSKSGLIQDLSRYTLFRIELYIMIIIVTIIQLFHVFDVGIVVFGSVLIIDNVIYYILSRIGL